jgi:hypothetical protein
MNITYIKKEMKLSLASQYQNPCQNYMHRSSPSLEFFKVIINVSYFHDQTVCGGLIIYLHITIK